jgi:hypothetical protein
MRRTRVSLVLATSLALVRVWSSTAASLVALDPVVTGAGDQWIPSANDTYIAYSSWTRDTGFRAVAEPLDGGAARRLNAAGTNGVTGAIDPGTDRVLYQEWTRRGSGLLFFDLETLTRSRAPGVNSPDWEWYPLLSSTFITFQRDRIVRGIWHTSFFVYHRNTGAMRKLGTWKSSAVGLFNGSVGDRYVAYTLCTNTGCAAFLYDWVTNDTRRVPTQDGRAQYAPVVDEVNDAIYFTRSAYVWRTDSRCGVGANVWRMPLDLTGDPERIVDLPDGIDTGWTASITPNGMTGQMDLYIERWDCARTAADIYVAKGVDAGPL